MSVMRTPSSLVLVLVAFLSGCQTYYVLKPDQIVEEHQDLAVVSVRLVDGTFIDFRSDLLGYAVIRDTTVNRTLPDRSVQRIPLSTIAVLNVRRPASLGENMVKGVLLAGLGLALLIVLVSSIHWRFG